ncbi:hypothetical protein SAMN05661091_1342 [Paenibacillus uliginis N3/975]|uniref:Uncharacterized protein n=1 Tax=Paenibacillus uliginis N3/975 TaxID=1313296 RepID=A0A1X7GYD5_9BACL|nr:hypothetical protein [Paenibacillus uliginis]SMF76704.1 hypothetical protein SAMN05661091_1342 [Paenibacillus uliginis N3/975]
MKKVSISQVFPRLALFSDENYRGRRFVVRGNLGIRNLDRLFGDIESLRFFSTNPNATLVLFSRPNFRGQFRVFRGNRNIADLDDIIRGEDAESLVMANFRLSLAQIRNIRNTGVLPQGFRRI